MAPAQLGEHQTLRRHIDDAPLGDDMIHAPPPGIGQGTFLDELGGAVLGAQLHGHDDLLGPVDQIHGPAHAEGTVGGGPVGQISVLGDLKRSQHRGSHAAGADDAEGLGHVKGAAPQRREIGNAAGVKEPVADLDALRRGPYADEAVLRLEQDAALGVVAAEAGDADAQIDHVAAVEIPGRTTGDKMSVIHSRASLHQDHVHKHPWHPDLIRADLPQVAEVVALHDGQVAAGGDHGMGGVAGAAPVDQIAQRVRLTAAGKGHIGPQGGLQQITFAVDLHRLLGVLHHSPQARFGQHAPQAQPAAADPLDEAAHGAEFGPQRPCLDLGCGLGLTAMVGQGLGARVTAVDYEEEALRFARKNAATNGVPQPFWTVMDWRRPAVAAGCMARVWGGDIMYEKRFVAPVLHFLDRALAPDGAAWVAEPGRTVYEAFLCALHNGGWQGRQVFSRVVEPIYAQPVPVTVRVWEIRRTPA